MDKEKILVVEDDEIIKASTATRNTIRERKTYQIINSIQTGSSGDKMTLDTSLVNLVKNNKISKEGVIFCSNNKAYVGKSLFSDKT